MEGLRQQQQANDPVADQVPRTVTAATPSPRHRQPATTTPQSARAPIVTDDESSTDTEVYMNSPPRPTTSASASAEREPKPRQRGPPGKPSPDYQQLDPIPEPTTESEPELAEPTPAKKKRSSEPRQKTSPPTEPSSASSSPPDEKQKQKEASKAQSVRTRPKQDPPDYTEEETPPRDSRIIAEETGLNDAPEGDQSPPLTLQPRIAGAATQKTYDELQLPDLPTNISEETKEEIVDPLVGNLKKKRPDPSTRSARDFAEVENVPTKDTLVFDDLDDEQEEMEGGMGGKLAIVGMTQGTATATANSRDDTSSVFSDTTEVLNIKRRQERRCGIYICLIGFLGVAVAGVLLTLSFLSDPETRPPSPAPTLQVRTGFPTPPPVRPPTVTTEAPTTMTTSSENPTAETLVEPTVVSATDSPTTTTATPIPTAMPTFATTTANPTAAPTSFPIQLPPVTIQAIQDDANSPQAQAYEWMLQDPNLAEYSKPRAQQRFALATLYYSTNGPNWTMQGIKQNNGTPDSGGGGSSDFLSYETHECEWMLPALTRQDTCNDQDQYLILFLQSRNLEGTLPPEVPLLLSPSTLQTLDLNNNLISGTIPTEMSSLTQLAILDLGLNQLTGPAMPVELTACTNLEGLAVHLNSDLASVLPTELGRLTKLEQFWIFGTQLSGVIPPDIGRLSRLKGLFLQDNQLTGTMPVSLFSGGGTSQQGGLSAYITSSIMSLEVLHLENNQITGPVPGQIRLLRSTLKTLNLETNGLTGNLPAELMQLASLRHLRLSHNPMLAGTSEGDVYNSGTVGSTSTMLRFDVLPNLQELTLVNTSITGELPSAVCNISVLEFDCSESLCGCDCKCSLQANNTVQVDTTPTASPAVDTLVPTEVISFELTDNPTEDATVVTLKPTTQGTGLTLEDLMLPNYTIRALEDPESPQSQAFTWLEEDPDYPDYSVRRAQQRFALATLWYSSRVTPWTNSSGWLQYGIHECSWFADPIGLQALGLLEPCELSVIAEQKQSFGIDGERQYIALLLPGNGLRGTLPLELALLPELKTVDLSGNLIIGFIPPTLGSLGKLEVLDFGHNFLQGQVPSELGTASSLENILIWANQIRGPIPSELGQLHDSLLSLGLSNNRLNATIPTHLGALSKLERLWISQNRLTGVLPSELGSLGALKTLDLRGNLITGEITTYISAMTSLEYLSVSRNRIEGGLVSEIGLLGSTLEHLDVSENDLQGTIPVQLWENLTAAKQINLSKNFFSGDLSRIGSVEQPLVHLFVSENQLTGDIPSELATLQSLESVDLAHNEFSRSIPTVLGTLNSLRHLKLNHNSIRGTIPSELGSLTELRHLLLHNSLISGGVPSSLGFLPKLETLTINATIVSGVIPPPLCRIDNLHFTCSQVLCGCNTCACPSLRKLRL